MSSTGSEPILLNSTTGSDPIVFILGWFGLSRIPGLMGLVVLAPIIYCQIKKRKKTQKQKQDKEKETVMELPGMLRELVVYNNEKPWPEVEKALDQEVGMEEQKVERFIENMIKEKPTRFSSQLLENFTSNYSSKLGEGGYGKVYKGNFPNGEQIAVKVLNNNGKHERIDDQFMAEVNTIGRTYHRNLVRLYGFCFEGKTKALVYEYMENGSLDKLLFEKKHRIERKKLYEIAVGAARGLEYLHHFSHKRIIHYDIKPANVLLDSNFCPKIADFGLAKLCDKDNTIVTLSGGKGTPGYAAPELWTPFPVSYKCDVYSFGVMLFEIIGRRRNVNTNLNESPEWFPLQVWKNFDRGELEDVFENCEIQEEDMVKAKTMVTLALWCVQYLPEARPSMRNVVKILEGEAEVASPPNPFQHLISSAKLPSCIGSSSNSTIDYDEDC